VRIRDLQSLTFENEIAKPTRNINWVYVFWIQWQDEKSFNHQLFRRH